MTRCPFCDRKWVANVCECGAYSVTEDTKDLPLKEQSYHKKSKH